MRRKTLLLTTIAILGISSTAIAGGHGGMGGGGFHGRGGFHSGFNREFNTFGLGGIGSGNWGYPWYSGYPYYGYYPSYSYIYPYDYYYSYPPYNYDQSPIVVQNDDYSPQTAPSALIQTYPFTSTTSKDTLYLIAFQDHRIVAAVAYWVEGDTLHYVTRQNEQTMIPLSSVDRTLTEQLNRDRRVDFRLPQ